MAGLIVERSQGINEHPASNDIRGDSGHAREARPIQPVAVARPSPVPTARERSRWRSSSRAIGLASAIALLLGLCLLVAWGFHMIEDGIKEHLAARTALYLEGFVEPVLQDAERNAPLSEATVVKLDAVFEKYGARLDIVLARIWGPDGVIIYSTDKAQIGRRLQVTRRMQRAWADSVEVGFKNDHIDHPWPSVNPNVVEIYVPVHQTETGEVIAIAELYAIAAYPQDGMSRLHFGTWIATAIVCLLAIGGLLAMVAKSSRTIERQRDALAVRIQDLSELLQQNEALRVRVQQASRRWAEGIELHLCRLGTDLHDGPAQLLALGLLKLDRILDTAKSSPEDRVDIRGVLSDAMVEIREISGGLALPEIKESSLEEALKLIIAAHERRTSTIVSVKISTKTVDLSHPVKLCLCRFVQEGLGNAYRHAGGVGQRVVGTWTDKLVVIEVSDQGKGFDTFQPKVDRSALGLVGLRNRIESLGGHMTIKSELGKGTRLTAYLSIGS